MHAQVGRTFPKLKPPSHYHTERSGLCPMVIALLGGLSKRFNTPLQVEHTVCSREGADHCEFTLTLPQAYRVAEASSTSTASEERATFSPPPPECSPGAEQFFTDLLERINAHPALHHPFLQRFATERLDRQEVRAYATQHYLYSRLFTRNLAAVIANTPDENARGLLILNLYEEIGEPTRIRDYMHLLLLEAGLVKPEEVAKALHHLTQRGGRDVVQALLELELVARDAVVDLARRNMREAKELTHPALFRRFLFALGLQIEDLPLTEPIPETRHFIEEYEAVCRDSHWLEGLGAMGPGTECVVPTLYSYVLKGLARSRVVSPPDQVFWTIHVYCDDGHGRNIINAMKPYADAIEHRHLIASGAMRVLDARMAWFDGLERHVFGD